MMMMMMMMMMTMMMTMMQVVMALLLKHERIERPHRSHCLCKDCHTQTNQDELKFARSRLNSYRALASEAYLDHFSPVQSSYLVHFVPSEAYLSLSTDDPILASFTLRRELIQIAKEEKYYTASL